MTHAARLWRRVNKTYGCWEWSGYITPRGYGLMSLPLDTPHGSSRQPHRIAYMLEVGPIADGMQIDHLCLNPACVRPDHLESVPPVVNSRRANVPGRVSEDPTSCAWGHALTAENLARNGDAQRCRECSNSQARKRRMKG